MTRYGARWSSGLRATTWAVVILLAFTAAAVLWLAAWTGGASVTAWIAAILVPVLAGSLWIARALAPRGFTVDPRAIRVERTLGDVIIPLDRLRSIARFPGPLPGVVQLLGSGGVFGYYGSFWNRSLGAFLLHATRRADLVLLDTDRERFLLSPDPAGPFVEEILSLAPRARRVEGAPPGGRRSVPARIWWAIAGAVALVPLFAAGAYGVSWAFAPCAISVGETAVTIERRWASPVEIALPEIVGVERLDPRTFHPRRIAGVAAPGFSYGRFRSDALGDFRLHAWNRCGLVLLETRSGRVIVTPDDPERFVEELRGRLGG